MTAVHFEFLVEEPSMEAFLGAIVPRLFGERATFTIHVHQGKADLLKKLASRLRGYAKWLPEAARIVVLVDRDDDDCRRLKERLERDAAQAGLATRSNTKGNGWNFVSRIAIEELEAWFFGDWDAVRKAYPKVPKSVIKKATYRDCDNIVGGTWEAFERVLKNSGYFSTGLRKKEAALEIGKHFDHSACTSPSFMAFRHALLEAAARGDPVLPPESSPEGRWCG